LGDSVYFSAAQPQTSSLLSVSPGALFFNAVANQPTSIINRGNLSTGKHLTLAAGNLDLQGQLRSGGDLTLQAQDTVKVRDSVTTPFLAQSGGNLTIIGNGGIDILALNHPTQTPFVSGGNLSLISDGVISGDARFSSGGSFSIKSISGGLANFVSYYDPIISANGDVDVAADYEGASLLVEATGNIRFGGNINITEPDTSALPDGPDTATLSTTSALILRSGQSTLAYGGVNSGNVPASGTGAVPAGITISGDVVVQPFNGVGGIVNLSAASGDVSTQLISTNGQQTPPFFNDANGGAISISAQDGSITTGILLSYSSSLFNTAENGGNISLSATNGSISTGDLISSSSSDFGIAGNTAGNGGNISLSTTNGSISTGDLISSSSSDFGTAGNGGNISLSTINGNISTLAVSSSSSSGFGTAGNGGNISLNATNGSINTGAVSSLSFSSPHDTAKKGGAISLFATNTINIFSLNSTGGSGSGDITIVSNMPFVLDNRNCITSDTFGSGNGGNILISAPSISLLGGAQIAANTHSSGQGGNITLRASEVKLSGATDETPPDIFGEAYSINGLPSGTYLGGFIPTGGTGQPPDETLFPSGLFTQITVDSTGNAGNVRIETERLTIEDGAFIAATTWGQGNAGNISVVPPDSISPDSISVDNGSILSGVAGGARGDSGNIELQSRTLSITGGGVVQTQTLGQGKAGDIQVTATDDVILSGTDSGLLSGSGGSNPLLGTAGSDIRQGGDITITTGSLSIADEAVVDAQTLTNSRGGDITVNANTLSASGSGRLLTSTSSGGQAGDITVNATELNLTGSSSGLFAQTASTASAGSLTLQPLGNGQTLSVNLQDGAQISASTSGSGPGGNLLVRAPQAVTISGNGQLSVETTGAGQAGDVTLTTDTFNINNGATVSATATATATTSEPSGSISVNANQVNLSGTGSGLLAETQGAADAGSLTLQPSNNGQSLTVNLQDNAQISASTSGSGRGGNLFVTAPQAVTISGNGKLSGETSGAGAGGNLNIETQQLTIQDGAQVSASTSSPNPNGVGGNLTVTATQSLDLNQASLLAQSTGAAPAGNIKIINTGNLTARDGNIATFSEKSSGGDITITASNIRLFGDSNITTRVNEGTGRGGDIDLEADSILAFDDSDILAYAPGGTGGNITLETPAFFGENYRPAPRNTDPDTLDGNNRVDVNATGAEEGVITIPDTTFIQNSLTELPDNQIDTDSLLANSCIVRRNEPTRGTFFITGTGGLPQRPGDAQMSTFPTVDIETLPNDGTPTNTNPNRPWQKGDPIVEPQGVYRLPNGNLVLSRECS
jgi:large exoprotein involved in heme utilization and adhesion